MKKIIFSTITLLLLSPLSFAQYQNDNYSSKILQNSKKTAFEKDMTQDGVEYFKSKKEELPPVTPATAISIPTGFGGEWGDYFIGATILSWGRNNGKKVDGVAAAGFSLWDPVNYVGIDISTWITDTYGDPFSDGSFTAKIHRRIEGHNASIAIGANGIAPWGRNSNVPSYYLAASKIFQLKQPYKAFHFIALHLGVGSGYFSGHDNFIKKIAKKNAGQDVYGIDSVGPFGGLSVGLARWVHFNASWTGQDVDTGFSFAPFERIPLRFDLFVKDLFEIPSQTIRSYGLNVSWSDNFLRYFN